MKPALFTLNKVRVVAKNNLKSIVLLNNLSFDIKEEEILGLIGKTGSGKTMIGKLLTDLLPDGVNLKSGDLFFKCFGATIFQVFWNGKTYVNTPAEL